MRLPHKMKPANGVLLYIQLTDVNARMQTTYSTATVSMDGNDLPLDPDLTNIMASSRDYNQLRDAWNGWRDASGKVMRDDYIRYTELNNEVATLNSKTKTRLLLFSFTDRSSLE